MAKLVFAMNVSLDGYVDHMELGPPEPAVFRHFVQQVRGLAGLVYGRRMYEIMRYWDDDLSEWECSGTRLRGSVAQSTEMGNVARLEVGRPQRHASRG